MRKPLFVTLRLKAFQNRHLNIGAENLNINRVTFLRNINGCNKTNKTGCIYA